MGITRCLWLAIAVAMQRKGASLFRDPQRAPAAAVGCADRRGSSITITHI